MFVKRFVTAIKMLLDVETGELCVETVSSSHALISDVQSQRIYFVGFLNSLNIRNDLDHDLGGCLAK